MSGHTSAPQNLNDWLQVVHAEYLEMPGLQLTKPQIRRLWGLEEPICDALVEALVHAHVLRHTGELYVLDTLDY